MLFFGVNKEWHSQRKESHLPSEEYHLSRNHSPSVRPIRYSNLERRRREGNVEAGGWKQRSKRKAGARLRGFLKTSGDDVTHHKGVHVTRRWRTYTSRRCRPAALTCSSEASWSLQCEVCRYSFITCTLCEERGKYEDCGNGSWGFDHQRNM